MTNSAGCVLCTDQYALARSESRPLHEDCRSTRNHHTGEFVDVATSPGSEVRVSLNPGAVHVTHWFLGKESNEGVTDFLRKINLMIDPAEPIEVKVTTKQEEKESEEPAVDERDPFDRFQDPYWWM